MDKNALFLYFDSDWKPYFAKVEDGTTWFYLSFGRLFDVTVVMLRETLRPVLQRRGMTLRKFIVIKDMAASLFLTVLDWLLVLWIIFLAFVLPRILVNLEL